MSEDSESVTKVEIYNRTYHVRSGDDPEYVKRLAAFVNARMLEVSSQTPTVDSLKVATLAALTIADELFEANRNSDLLDQDSEESCSRMVALLENCMGVGPT